MHNVLGPTPLFKTVRKIKGPTDLVVGCFCIPISHLPNGGFGSMTGPCPLAHEPFRP